MIIIAFILIGICLLPILALLHMTHVENKRISIRWRINDFYVTNHKYYNQNTEWIDIILDFCNEYDKDPEKICRYFPEDFIKKCPEMEAIF